MQSSNELGTKPLSQEDKQAILLTTKVMGAESFVISNNDSLMQIDVYRSISNIHGLQSPTAC